MNNDGLTKSSEKMMDALFAFKDRVGNGGAHSANTILEKLLGIDIGTTSLDYKHFHLPEPLFKNRINFISTGAEGYFTSVNANKPTYTPLANGAESLVMDCNNGYVLKLMVGEGYNVPKSTITLQEIYKGYSQNLDVSFGVFEKIEPKEVSSFTSSKMVIKAARQGIFINDPGKYNFGMKNDENGKKLVLLDGGAARYINSNRDFLSIAKLITRPLYQNIYGKMPFIHPHWRQFKKSVHTCLGAKKGPIPDHIPMDLKQ